MKTIISAWSFALTHVAVVTAAFAQEGGAGAVAGQESTMPGGTLALVAYVILWVLVFGFVFITMRRQRAIDAELEELDQRMDEVFDDLDKM